MKEYSIVNVQGDFYIACRENDKRKNLTKQESLHAFNNLFLQDIIGLKKADNILIVSYKDIKVRISDWNSFIEKFQNTQFVYNIEEFAEANNLMATSRNNATRKNKNVGKTVKSVALAGALTVTSFIANANYKKKTENISIEPTTAYTRELAQNENAKTITEEKITIVEPTTKEITTEEPTTEELTTTEPTTNEITTTEPPTAKSQKVSSLSGYDYKNDYADGFIVTSGNKTYDISDADFDLMCATVMSEGGENPNEALAVSSVILNRCDSGGWGGHTVREVILADHQFEVIEKGYYLKYMNGNAPDTVKMAVRDALNGLRNCEYESFRAYSEYSSNNITSNGNYYR